MPVLLLLLGGFLCASRLWPQEKVRFQEGALVANPVAKLYLQRVLSGVWTFQTEIENRAQKARRVETPFFSDHSVPLRRDYFAAFVEHRPGLFYRNLLLPRNTEADDFILYPDRLVRGKVAFGVPGPPSELAYST